MRITIEFKGPFRRISGESCRELSLEEGSRVEDLRRVLLSQFDQKYDNILEAAYLFRNGLKLADEQILIPGENLALLMAVLSGG